MLYLAHMENHTTLILILVVLVVGSYFLWENYKKDKCASTIVYSEQRGSPGERFYSPTEDSYWAKDNRLRKFETRDDAMESCVAEKGLFI